MVIYMPVQGQRPIMGVKLSPQISWLSVTGEGLSSQGPLLGMDFGLNLDAPLSAQCYFNTGLSLSNIGGSLLYTDSLSAGEIYPSEKIQTDQPQLFKNIYLKIPASLKFKTDTRGVRRFYTYLGIDAMFRLRSVLITESDKNVKYSITSEISTFNLASHLGGGIELFLPGETVLQIGILYSQGFINAIKDKDYQIHENIVALDMSLFF